MRRLFRRRRLGWPAASIGAQHRHSRSAAAMHPGGDAEADRTSRFYRDRGISWTLHHVRRFKMFLLAGGVCRQGLIPLSDTLEVWLTDGFAEVLFRIRQRLLRRPVRRAPRPARPTFGARTRPVTIPPPRGAAGITSIVIPVLDQPVMTLNCLRAIVENSPSGSYEVIVVDNNSGAATREALEDVEGLHLVRNNANFGFVTACNQGAQLAHGEFLLFLNNDTLVQPGWLEALTETFEGRTQVAAAGAKLLNANGDLQEAGGIIWSDGDGWNYGRNGDPDAPEYCYAREVDYCSGACLMVRRQAFEQLNGFDTRYSPAYYEDTDLCFRLRERGYVVMYQPAARVVHLEGATAGTDTTCGYKSYQVTNRHKFVERHAAALALQLPHDSRLVPIAADRNRGKRILVVDHVVPRPDHDSGSVRMTAILRALNDVGYRVTFLPDNLERLEPYVGVLQQRGIEVVYGAVSPVRYLEERLHEFDIVILCRAHFAAQYLPSIVEAEQRPFVVFDTVDLHYLREQRYAELTQDENALRRAAHTRELETAIMRASDMVWVTSAHEREVLQKHEVHEQIAIVPNIHDVRTDVPGFSERRDLLFIGGFEHPPNEDALLYFVNDIFPLVRRELPGVRLRIVGSNVPASIRRLAAPDIEVHGFVPDVEPLFDAVRISVAPLRYGAGVKGKITQSLALGVPVVTTPVGAEGMHVQDGEQLLVAQNPVDFARRVVDLYRDQALWARLSQNGLEHMRRHFAYPCIRISIETLLEAATRGRSTKRHLSLPKANGNLSYADGFYSPEDDGSGPARRWMGSEGVIRLRNHGRAMILTIHGGTPQLDEPATVNLSLNGEPLDLFVATGAIERRYHVHARESHDGDFELRITTSRTFVPQQVDPTSADRRRLGLALWAVSWTPLDSPSSQPEAPSSSRQPQPLETAPVNQSAAPVLTAWTATSIS